MALAILLIIDIAIIILVLNILFLLFMRDGVMAKNNVVYSIIIGFTLAFSFIVYTSIPDNYIIKKIITIVICFIVILSVFLKKNNFNISRNLLTIAIITNLIIFFL